MFDPAPNLDGPYQPGITDPQWPIEPPGGLTSDARERYVVERAGRIDPQHFLTVITADLAVSERDALRDTLSLLSGFVRVQMTRQPDQTHLPVLKELPKSWRVTITLGFGSTLFYTRAGDDRFGFRHRKPRWLRVMPKVFGDAYEPEKEATDLLIAIASDHPYVNVSIGRAIVQGYWAGEGKTDKRIDVRRLEQGFSRPDRREFLRFDDGIDNLSNRQNHELDRMVYVQHRDDEPNWCVNGSYLAWRKIRENLPIWEAFAQPDQEKMIGRSKDTGKPLSRESTGPGEMTPVYPNTKNPSDGPLTAHIRKVQPRREGPDFLGTEDLQRRFLRRGYPFFDGVEADGRVRCGLHFLAFARSIVKQFEWPVQIWQTNPDFPCPGTGVDALYGREVLTNTTGGYYFCPSAPADAKDFIGSGLFS